MDHGMSSRGGGSIHPMTHDHGRGTSLCGRREMSWCGTHRVGGRKLQRLADSVSLSRVRGIASWWPSRSRPCPRQAAMAVCCLVSAFANDVGRVIARVTMRTGAASRADERPGCCDDARDPPVGRAATAARGLSRSRLASERSSTSQLPRTPRGVSPKRARKSRLK
jgi:hypothetical protein